MLATHILIVEDEPMIAEAILYALETDGFKATWVDTGQAALDVLRLNMLSHANDNVDNLPFDLIVMDVGLPDINGFELFRELRQRHDLPVIFLTARAGEVDRVVGLELGADDYIAKPFSPRELCARVRTVLRRLQKSQTAANQATPVLAASSPFLVDDIRKTIHYCNQKLTLSRTEYRLLQILIAAPGRVFTRDALMQQAWEHPEVSADRTVDSHIKMLRNQLRQITPDDEPIITHRGIGYALKEWQ